MWQEAYNVMCDWLVGLGFPIIMPASLHHNFGVLLAVILTEEVMPLPLLS